MRPGHLGEEGNYLDNWWMKLVRRSRGVTKFDKMRSSTILSELKASALTELVEERQLRYLGHAWRYGEERWTKFMLQAERPGQVKKGRRRQYRKLISQLLIQKNLNTDMMQEKESWRAKLQELYPRGAKTTESTGPPLASSTPSDSERGASDEGTQ